MRALTIIVLLGAALWSGWWVVGSTGVDRGARAGIEALQAEGWQVAYDDLSVGGFPNRFDTEVTGLRLATPSGEWAVAAPFFQVFALSYRPNEVIVVPAPAFEVTTPLGPVAVVSEDLRASAPVALASPPDLGRATVVGAGVTATLANARATLEAGQVAVRQAPEVPMAYDVALTLTDLEVPVALVLPALPGRYSEVALDAEVRLDGPAAAGGQVQEVTLRSSSLAWEGARLALSGEVKVGVTGLLDGALTLQVEGAEEVLRLATALGLPPGQAAILLGGLSGLSDETGRAEVPLTLRRGQLLFGTIPLASIPALAR